MEGLDRVSKCLSVYYFFLPLSHWLFSLLVSGRVTPATYDQVYSLETLTDGLAALEKRQTWGKAVVRVREENVKAKL